MASLEDATKLVLIDYEYGMWNPQYYDIANYLNEYCCENAYPKGTGVAYYMQNWPTMDEIESLTQQYFQLLQGSQNKDTTWSSDKVEC